jgi:hypothetical protein
MRSTVLAKHTLGRTFAEQLRFPKQESWWQIHGFMVKRSQGLYNVLPVLDALYN